MKNVLILGGPGNISESTIRYFLEKKRPGNNAGVFS